MDDFKEILDSYDMPEKTPVLLIRESKDNKVYVVGDFNKSVIRVSKRLSSDDVQFEYECLKQLSLSGVPVATWVTATDGRIFTTTNDGSVCVVSGFIEGEHIVVDKEHKPTAEQAFEAGKNLGQIAEAGKDFGVKLKRTRNIYSELERALAHRKYFIEKFDNGREFVDSVEEMISFAKNSDSLIGLIHNDFRSHNVLFDKTGSVSAVLDFDWSCIGPLMKDVALGVLEWSFPDGADSHDITVFDAFLEGYFSSCDLLKDRTDLNKWIMFAALSDAATYFCDSIDELDSSQTILRSYMYKKFKYFSML